MNILTISGSNRSTSSNVQLLRSLQKLFPEHSFTHYQSLHLLPLFQAELDMAPWTTEILEFRAQVSKTDAVIMSTPEYIHNMPAQLKNALEWLTSSGELVGKPVLPITYTPSPPRGERAMQSLLWSLTALDTKIVTSLALHQTEIRIEGANPIASAEVIDMLKQAVDLL